MPETVGRETAMRSAASRTSSGPQTHRQKSIVNAPKEIPRCEHLSLERRAQRGGGAEDVLDHQHGGGIVPGRDQPEDIDLFGQQLVAKGDH